ncbi:MAG: tRNA pseudouridine(13) synthase TruD [Gammaproteobacteria bacterium]|nr:MAG: tRNA pseudouridine(13) synthase TruD [Gammaproteobacteria bacterium]
MKSFDFSTLPRVNPLALSCSADIRSKPDYFQVDEQLPFEPDGEGGHVWLQLQKRGINTDWLATELAKFAGVPSVAVGYAGLKDRHAITTQWFSIKMEGVEEPEWSEFETEDIKIITQTRHGKKLKRGVLTGNVFKLRLTNIQGDKVNWERGLKLIQQQGVPNYFGEQRFGHQAGNLHRVEYWFSTGKAPRKRNQKSMYLSAARSWLFNLVLAERVKRETWQYAISGDVMLLAGTKGSIFNIDDIDETIKTRVAAKDIHPTGVMWGRGTSQSQTDSLALEQQVLVEWQVWLQGLEKAGLSQDRRALRLYPSDFAWQYIDDEQLELSFFLPAGCYATSVMRELAVIADKAHRNYHDEKAITDSKSTKAQGI